MKINSEKLIDLLNVYIEDNTIFLKDEEAKNKVMCYGEGLYKGKILAYERLIEILKSDDIENIK